MRTLEVYLALQGVAVLTISMVAGLLLHRAIRLDQPVEAWHLAHAGGSGRGVFLIALAPIVRWAVLTPAQAAAIVWLMSFFVWTSTAAMVIAAARNQRGLTWAGSFTSRLVFGLYVVSAIAVFPAAFLLMLGLLRAA